MALPVLPQVVQDAVNASNQDSSVVLALGNKLKKEIAEILNPATRTISTDEAFTLLMKVMSTVSEGKEAETAQYAGYAQVGSALSTVSTQIEQDFDTVCNAGSPGSSPTDVSNAATELCTDVNFFNQLSQSTVAQTQGWLTPNLATSLGNNATDVASAFGTTPGSMNAASVISQAGQWTSTQQSKSGPGTSSINTVTGAIDEMNTSLQGSNSAFVSQVQTLAGQDGQICGAVRSAGQALSSFIAAIVQSYKPS